MQLSARHKIQYGYIAQLGSSQLADAGAKDEVGYPGSHGATASWQSVNGLEYFYGSDAYGIDLRRGHELSGGYNGLLSMWATKLLEATRILAARSDLMGGAELSLVHNSGVSLRFPPSPQGLESMQKAVAVLLRNREEGEPIKLEDFPPETAIGFFAEDKAGGRLYFGARAGVELELEKRDAKPQTSEPSVFAGPRAIVGGAYQGTRQSGLSEHGGVARRFDEYNADGSISLTSAARTGNSEVGGKANPSMDLLNRTLIGRSATYRGRMKVVTDENRFIRGGTEYERLFNISDLPGRDRLSTAKLLGGGAFRLLMDALENSGNRSQRILADNIKAILNSLQQDQVFSVVVALDTAVAAALNDFIDLANIHEDMSDGIELGTGAKAMLQQLRPFAQMLLETVDFYRTHRIRASDIMKKYEAFSVFSVGVAAAGAATQEVSFAPTFDGRADERVGRDSCKTQQKRP